MRKTIILLSLLFGTGLYVSHGHHPRRTPSNETIIIIIIIGKDNNNYRNSSPVVEFSTRRAMANDNAQQNVTAEEMTRTQTRAIPHRPPKRGNDSRVFAKAYRK